MKYKVIKSVRYKNRDLKVGEIIELSKSDDLINLLQVGALEKYVDVPPPVEAKPIEKEQESLFKLGPKKNRKE